jgi:hypothetical protein
MMFSITVTHFHANVQLSIPIYGEKQGIRAVNQATGDERGVKTAGIRNRGAERHENPNSNLTFSRLVASHIGANVI